jgi:hypothetical protein
MQPSRRSPGLSLLTRVFLANGAVLLALALLLIFSPVEIDFPVTSTQALIIVSGFLVSLIVNALLLRPVIAPLRRLADAMRAVDPSEPGRRLFIPHADAEVTARPRPTTKCLTASRTSAGRAGAVSSPPRRGARQDRP